MACPNRMTFDEFVTYIWAFAPATVGDAIRAFVNAGIAEGVDPNMPYGIPFNRTIDLGEFTYGAPAAQSPPASDSTPA